MSSHRDQSSYINRLQRYWRMPSVTLVLGFGLGEFAGISHVLADSPLAGLLPILAFVLVGIALMLSDRRRHARAQNDTEFLRARNHMLQAQAHHDDLTGLANRLLLADRFRFAVERAKRGGKSFALLMLDLNHFKSINDNHGHAAGDLVLVTTAKRLLGVLRASDTVARLGGDEFVLIIESTENLQELAHIGQKLMDTVSDTITLKNGVGVCMGASIGLALYPDDGADMNDLLYAADMAMYQCKSSGQMPLQMSLQ